MVTHVPIYVPVLLTRNRNVPALIIGLLAIPFVNNMAD
jgi:hypothetical protein